MKERKTNQINVRFKTPDIIELITQAAEHLDESREQFCRKAIAERTSKTLRKRDKNV